MQDDEIRLLLQQAWKLEDAKQFAGAEELFRKASAGRPDDAKLQVFHASSLAKLGRNQEAIGEFQSLVEKEPANRSAWQWLSVLYSREGRLEQACQAQERVVELKPEDLNAINRLIAILLDLKRLEPAAEILEKQIEKRPQEPALHAALATVRWRLNDAEGCIQAQRRAVDSRPEERETLLDYLMHFRRFEEALSEAQQSSTTKARQTALEATRALGRFAEADLALNDWLGKDPENPAALVFAGNMAMERGELDTARDAFAKALPNASAYFGLQQAGAVWPPSSPEFEAMQAIARSPTALPRERYELHLALGTCLESDHQYGAAIEQFDLANRIVLAGIDATKPFDIRATRKEAQDAEQEFRSEQKEDPNDSELPIFVIGMIRSGTSLVEQILASHPDVAGAGEQFFWPDHQWPATPEAARNYLKTLQTFGPQAKRIVDKMPGNFMFVGPIHRVLPNARFVHIRRHPIDTCLSIWSTYFQSPPPFTGSRANTVAMYREYERIMAVWRRVLPPSVLFEIDYEELVENREEVIGRLIEFCGLPWNDTCLHPERRKGRVWTPSHVRVRQPIDSKRVARWRNFEPWLGEFADLLIRSE